MLEAQGKILTLEKLNHRISLRIFVSPNVALVRMETDLSSVIRELCSYTMPSLVLWDAMKYCIHTAPQGANYPTQWIC